MDEHSGTNQTGNCYYSLVAPLRPPALYGARHSHGRIEEAGSMNHIASGSSTEAIQMAYIKPHAAILPSANMCSHLGDTHFGIHIPISK